MAELKLMTVDQICDILKTGCDKYYETQSVVNWKFMNNDNLPMCKVSDEAILFVFILIFICQLIIIYSTILDHTRMCRNRSISSNWQPNIKGWSRLFVWYARSYCLGYC